MARALRSVFDCPDRPAVELRLKQIVTHYAQSAPKLAPWLETNCRSDLNDDL